MIFITTYKVRPFMSKAETAELMTLFGERGEEPGTVTHYVAADGSHGVVIAENDDPTDGYKAALAYEQWIQFDTKVYLPVEQAAPLILEALA